MKLMPEIEKGQLTTDFVTYITPILVIVGLYVTENPGPIEAYLGVFWTGLIIAIITGAIVNYKNPRPVNEE